MPNPIPPEASIDVEALNALWKAIWEAVEQLSPRCAVYSSPVPDDAHLVHFGKSTPEIKPWQLVEALSLLAILVRADEIENIEILNLFGKTGPIRFTEDGLGRFLWAQQSLQGEQSALGGRPDLIVTSSPERPTTANVLRVVEAKCRRRLDTQTIRAEFGKAYDLKVATYFIWTYYSATPRVVEGAKRLGLDVVELGFDTLRRKDLIEQPATLLSYVAHALEQSRKVQRFAAALEEAGQDVGRKLLG
jgi:hypothetical protein